MLNVNAIVQVLSKTRWFESFIYWIWLHNPMHQREVCRFDLAKGDCIVYKLVQGIQPWGIKRGYLVVRVFEVQRKKLVIFKNKLKQFFHVIDCLRDQHRFFFNEKFVKIFGIYIKRWQFVFNDSWHYCVLNDRGNTNHVVSFWSSIDYGPQLNRIRMPNVKLECLDTLYLILNIFWLSRSLILHDYLADTFFQLSFHALLQGLPFLRIHRVVLNVRQHNLFSL